MSEGIILELNQPNAVIMTNDGQFLSIPAKENWRIGEAVTISEFEIKMSQSKRKKHTNTNSLKKAKSVFIVLVASLLFFLIPLSSITKANTIVTLDINPSIEMEIHNGEVVDVRPLNDDAKKVISRLDESSLHGDYYQVTSQIINQAEQLGYLKPEEENVIMVGVLKNDKNFEPNKFEQYIKDTLNNKNLSADVLVLNATKSEKKIADEKGVSLGKYLLQEKEKENGIIISDNDLSKKSVKDIIKTVKEQEKSKRSEGNNWKKGKNSENPKNNKSNSDNKGNKIRQLQIDDNGKNGNEDRGNNKENVATENKNNNNPKKDNGQQQGNQTDNSKNEHQIDKSGEKQNKEQHGKSENEGNEHGNSGKNGEMKKN